MGKRHVDPVKVHLVTLAIWGFGIAVVLFVVLFPKVILFVGLTIAAAWLYAKLFAIVEARLENLEPIFDDDDEPTPPPKKANTADTELDAIPPPPLATTVAPDLDADD